MNKIEIKALNLLYYDLCRLLKYSEYHNSTLECILEDFEYLLTETQVNFINKTAQKLFKKFSNSISNYHKSIKYSEFSAIKFVDPDYIKILKEHLVPLISEAEKSYVNNNLQFDKCDMVISFPENHNIIYEIKFLLNNK